MGLRLTGRQRAIIKRKTGERIRWIVAESRSGFFTIGCEEHNMAVLYQKHVAVLDEFVKEENPPPVDLSVDRFKVLRNGEQTAYHARVCNSGPTAVKRTFKVSLYLDRRAAPNDTSKDDASRTVTQIAVGKCLPLTFHLALPPGTYRSWIYLDSADALPEIIECLGSWFSRHDASRE